MAQPPPGSLGMPYVGEALTFLKDPFGFTLERTRRHGNVWKTKILGDKVVFFAGPDAFAFFMDPDHFTRQAGSPKFLQELLHPDAVPFLDGDRHKTRKRLLLSAFTDAALDSYLPSIFAVIDRFVKRWAGGERAIAGELPQLGFDIADVLFAAADPATSNEVSGRDFTIMNRGTFSPPINLPFTGYGKALKARDRLRAYIKHAVATKDGKGSALGILKSARGPAGEQLPTGELEIELLHFYFAAHGALTAALAWLIVVLGQQPELAAKLRAEADGKLGDAVPNVAQVRSLSLARAVSRETLRAFPFIPITFFGVAKRDLEYGGFTIPAGWKGTGAIWATLHDSATFRDPSAFQSDRLGDAALGSLPKHAFVPQGGGPPDGHLCAGEALIQLIMPAFVGWFTRRYDLAWPEQDVTPGPGGVGPLPRGGMRVAITPRR
jgi:cytochrome P450